MLRIKDEAGFPAVNEMLRTSSNSGRQYLKEEETEPNRQSLPEGGGD